MTVDLLEPIKPDSSITLTECFADLPSRLEVRSQPVRVKEILRFKRNGRTLAYEVRAGFTDGNGAALGMVAVLLFYDPDGSGGFTIQRGVSSGQPLFIPDWVIGTRVH